MKTTRVEVMYVTADGTQDTDLIPAATGHTMSIQLWDDGRVRMTFRDNTNRPVGGVLYSDVTRIRWGSALPAEGDQP